MLLRMLKTHVDETGVWEADRFYEVDDKIADHWIKVGTARKPTPKDMETRLAQQKGEAR